MEKARFWNNKDYVIDWLKNCDLRFSVELLGRGHRGVLLFIFDESKTEEFIVKYNGTESEFASFCITRNMYTKGSPLYISLAKFGYNYGSKYTRKPKNKNKWIIYL